jgi:hypothetical protein
LRLDDFTQKGLYLLFEDSTVLALTESNIESISERFWGDPEKVTADTRRNVDFHPCSICPEAGQDVMCYTLRPVLPFLEEIDRFFSFERVTAIYRGDEDRLLHIAEADMQTALQYVCILSLLSYCRVGRKYWKYYHGVIPIMGADSAVQRLYLNVYWIHKGDRTQINRFIEQFREEISVICGNVIRRLNLICKKDSFVNAFFHMQVAAELLSMDMDEVLKKTFQKEETFRNRP